MKYKENKNIIRGIIAFIFSMLAFLALILFDSCKTVQPVTINKTDTLLVQRIDTVKERYLDSVIIKEKGDTIWIEKYKFAYKNKIQYRDSVRIQNKEIPINVPTPFIPTWCWWCLGLLIGIVLFTIGKIAFKIYKTFVLHI